jgi:hypothetical protein
MLCKYIFIHMYPLGRGIIYSTLFSQNQYTLMKHMPQRYVNLKNYTLFTNLDIGKKYMYPKSNMFWHQRILYIYELKFVTLID